MSKTTIRIASMNLENLFTPGQSFYGSSYTQGEYDGKIAWIASRIVAIDAHVVALQELGDDAAANLTAILALVNADLPAGATPFQHQFVGQAGGTSTQIRNAIVSRFPLTNGGSLANYPANFQVDLHQSGPNAQWMVVPSPGYSRPIAFATVNPPNGADPFNVFVCHLKSKRPNTAQHDGYNEAVGTARSAIQRNVEAAALRYHLDAFLPAQFAQDPKVATLLVGDFNDTPNSVPAENIRGPFDASPGPGSPWSDPDKRRLLSCARLHLKKAAYEDKLFSYIHNESFTLIDQAFVSEHWASKFKHMEIYNDHVLRHADMSSSTTEIENQWKSAVSDHGIVVLEFNRVLKTN